MSETSPETISKPEVSAKPRMRTKPTRDVGQVVPLFMIGIGLYLSWFGVHYWRDSSVKWPTDPIKAALTGKGLPTATKPPSWESVISSNASIAEQVNTSGNPPGGDTGASNATAAQNQATGKLLAARYGWSTGDEWSSLIKLWNRESGWNNKAKNPSSGAYGIPQALPASKMSKAAQAPPVGSSDPSAQIEWGLSYIKERYNSPSSAWNHEVKFGWY